MCKFTRYRVIQDRGLFYIEIPIFVVFWIRLYRIKYVETQDMYRTLIHDYEFTSKEDAIAFAEANVYKILT